MSTKEQAVQVKSLSKRDATISILIVGLLFFIFGFVTWVNAILIPYFKIACELNNFQSYLVAFAFYIAYLVMSLPAAMLLKKIGFKKGMMAGFWAMAAGALLFVPAASSRTFAVFLIGLFTIGMGLAVLQTAANPYITILGPKERAAQRFSIMGICNKLAGIIAPLLFAAVILRPSDSDLFKEIALMQGAEKAALLDELIQRVITPYTVVAVVLFLLGLFVRYSPLPEIDTDTEDEELAASNSGKRSILDFPHLVLGAVAIFFHVGSQVIAVDSVINYASGSGVPFLEAKVFPSYTLTATIIGYLLGISFIPKILSQLNALKICTVLGLVLSMLILTVRGEVTLLGHTTDISVWLVVLLGFANSMIWAGVWPLALDNLGRFIKTGASLLIMGLCGNAILPLTYGHFADTIGLRGAYWVLLPCYLYLIFYAFHGHRTKTWKLKQFFHEFN
ncbi:sugar MFS transporter [Pararcticibacter amylolyticus]|uniref:Glucose/galactose MFS transporter n=1 Tax=Pararcticibacter amylolyticus TaxID=2173175 RepID=A0A2U2PKM0_9SPHI|nr:sugar MFS transporter [Pararcticibacter amylolyticus]PWG81953.1 glucose/galactose MFS transporter [Pararcticibacter amylolyticus]